jgi:tRNA (mo5U34)-methyltransferase
MSLCKNVGFNNVEIFNERASSIDEQRKTEFAPYESLEDFLDKNDRSKTIEGYVSPNRAIILARKKK